MSCPFLEYHLVQGQHLPFCRALQPGRDIRPDALQFICTTPRHKICTHYDAAVIDAESERQGTLGSPQQSFLETSPSHTLPDHTPS